MLTVMYVLTYLRVLVTKRIFSSRNDTNWLFYLPAEISLYDVKIIGTGQQENILLEHNRFTR